jgi:hypothetical protein
MSEARAQFERVAVAKERQLHKLIEEYSRSCAEDRGWQWRSFPTGGRRVNQFGLSEQEYAAGEMAAVQRNAEQDPGSSPAMEPRSQRRTAKSCTARIKGNMEREPQCVRTFWRSGIWHVTKDDTFYGHYLEARSALHAAIDAALDIGLEGGAARIVFGPPAHHVNSKGGANGSNMFEQIISPDVNNGAPRGRPSRLVRSIQPAVLARSIENSR